VKVVLEHSHNSGIRRLKERGLGEEVLALFESPSIRLERGGSARAKTLVSAKMRHGGWAMGVRLDPDRGAAVNAIKDEVALQIQFGNMARAFYDLMKLQSLFQQGRAQCAVLVLPSQRAARVLGANHASFERVRDELESMFATQISMPMAMYGVE